MNRALNRCTTSIRPLTIKHNFIKHAEGSVLISLGDTKIICSVSVTPGVPRFLKGTGQGWLTAEYAMLPRSTEERITREAVSGKVSGRSQEISRLIGRTLRSALDLKKLGELTLHVDCDVIQADGSTRCTAITGAMIAVVDAISLLQKRGLKNNPLRYLVAAVSVGILKDKVIVDLDYQEDMQASTDLNLIMNDQNAIIEVQGTAEKKPFTKEELNHMLEIGSNALQQIFTIQKQLLK